MSEPTRADNEEAEGLPPWRYCEGKKQLIKDILDETIEGWDARKVHAFRPLYTERAFSKFKTNLGNLRNLLLANQHRATEDSIALAHDLALDLPGNSKPYPIWQGSEAERLLKLDLDLKKHERLKPMALHASREEFADFPLDVFRDHIYQEVRTRKGRSYWMARKEEKEAQKAKKNKKKKDAPPPKRLA